MKINPPSIHEDPKIAELLHEIKNPLTTVKGFLQLLKPHMNNLEHEQYIQMALEEVNRTNELLTRFLQSAKQEPFAPIYVHPLLKYVAHLYAPELQSRGGKLLCLFAPSAPVIMGRESELQQLFVNIVKNAIEAIHLDHESPLIVIETTVAEDFIHIHVHDNGHGMSEDMLQQVFTSFYSTKQTGTGIGLSICKDITLRHHGDISYQSTLEEGTTCIIKFPLV